MDFPSGYSLDFVDFSPASMEFFPSGYSFEPDEEQLILDYLNKKVAEPSLRVSSFIKEVDIYSFHPTEFLAFTDDCSRKNYYFFTQRKRKHQQGSSRASRQAKDGSVWKATSGQQPVNDSKSNTPIGLKTTLVYFENKNGIKAKTNWIMHEFQTLLETPNKCIQRKRKHQQGSSRASRQAKDGSVWKATSGQKPFKDSKSNKTIGLKTTLVYIEKNKQGIKAKTNWIMHEFQTLLQETPTTTTNKLYDWVICRIHERVQKKAAQHQENEVLITIVEEEDGVQVEDINDQYGFNSSMDGCIGERKEDEDHGKQIAEFYEVLNANISSEQYMSLGLEEEDGEVGHGLNNSMDGCIGERKEQDEVHQKELEELHQLLDVYMENLMPSDFMQLPC
ncbi:NAC domain-containing protein 35-like [Telopea speciosissima]|uniref:NAC domain-containing protein 35-like n=1 Tax=Telopea speciosissima TaxID=54955 RepID=UPI001CC50BB9|nr:NAC domain-containing protein 35-like [Telopea speciosissima]